jgi:hypothetical protein
MGKARQSQPLIVWAVLACASLAGFAAIILIPVWLMPPLSKAELAAVPAGEKRITLQQAQGQLQNNVRTTLLQGLGGIVLVTGAVATWRQLRLSREGQITDRFTHAIDQLGDDKVDIRIGAIFALERLARDSVIDRLAIGETLAAFIRTHAPWPAGHPSHPSPHPTPNVDLTMLWLTDRAPDVRAAVLVLGRFPRTQDDPRLAIRRVDLRRTNFYHSTLVNVDLRDSNLAGCYAATVSWQECVLNNTDLRMARLAQARLDRSRFKGAYLQDVDLEGATLQEADLSGASLYQAKLRGADLHGAILTGADLSYADLRDAILIKADLRGAVFTGADLLGAKLDDIQTDQATIWPAGFTP